MTALDPRAPERQDRAPDAAWPMTDSQRGLLVVDRTVAAKHLYNQPAEFDIDPRLDVDAVLAALATLVVVQPSLRLCFPSLPEPHALLRSPEDAPLHVVDAGTCAPDEFDERRESALERLGTYAFDLARGPLYGVAFLRSADGARASVLLSVHHTVTDGWSIQPLIHDLAALLDGALQPDEIEALRREREAALERELRVQRRIAEEVAASGVPEQWAKELRDVPATVLYPRPERPAETSFAGRRLQWRLEPGDTARLDEVLADLSATPFQFFTAVYGAVVARFASASQVIVGSPFMVRRTAKSYDLCGFFVNTLPIVVDVDWSATLAEHVRASIVAVDKVRSRSNVAFNQLVRALAPDRSTDRNPVFSCMLAMQSAAEPAAGSAVLAARELGNGTAKFDLWLGATPDGGGWLLELEHDVELVGDALAGDILEALATAFTRAVHDPALAVRDLFDDDARGDSYASDGFGRAPQERTVDALLCARWPADGGKVAVEDETGTLSYDELRDAVASVAGALREVGIRPGDIVGITLETLTDTVVALLATLRAGAAYLPLDVTLPAQRLEYMVERSGCEFIIGRQGVGDVGPTALETLRGTGATPLVEPAGADGQVSEGVYVMFTSGSTGNPKGVHMQQRALVNLVDWQSNSLGMDSTTRFLQYAPLGFDVSFQETFPTLATGGTVVSRQPAERGDFPAVVERIAATRPTHVYLPVAALASFVRAVGASGQALDSVRYMCVSGEQLRVDERIRAFFDERPGCVLVNMYGPTETHASTSHRLRPSDGPWPNHVPIGTPTLEIVTHVVDASGHLAPRCVAGELLLGGGCPALGYIGEPERTAEVFIPDPFGDGIVYRTGDRVLRDEHGLVVFLGRDDNQVKIRGYRVELGEIETVAGDAAGVGHAVACARRTAGGDAELLLFVVPDHGRPPDAEALREELERTLPGYMVPKRIYPVDAVPMTANGKVDRPALLADAERRIAEEHDQAQGGEADYADELERDLAALWSKILDRPVADPRRSLISYGAHSLSVFTVLAEVGERYGVDVPIVEFFRTPTVSALARMVRAALPSAQPAAVESGL